MTLYSHSDIIIARAVRGLPPITKQGTIAQLNRERSESDPVEDWGYVAPVFDWVRLPQVPHGPPSREGVLSNPPLASSLRRNQFFRPMPQLLPAALIASLALSLAGPLRAALPSPDADDG